MSIVSEEQFRAFATMVVMALEGLGIALLAIGVTVAFVRAAIDLFRREADVFGTLRGRLGRAILLSLEVLIAGDIVRTVAVETSIENVAVLALIVLVRTVLSFVLELEISGQWPWQKKKQENSSAQ